MGDDDVGRILGGRYRVLRLIGLGGMGAVYEAEQLDLRRRVAIKLLQTVDARSVERFRQEALATATLRSPHVVMILDFVVGEPPFLVMELLDGQSLQQLLSKDGRLSVERATAITRQMLSGLAAAHAAGIVHRDVKPANVFLVPSAVGGDLVKLLDFGVAKVLAPDVTTTTGSLAGTPAYMSPEQLRGEKVDARSDIHSVGVCLFQMLTGRRPWRSTTGPELVAEILRDEPLSLAAILPNAPASLNAIVMRALAKDREHRFATAEEMIAALEQPAVPLVHDLPTAYAPLAAPAKPPAPEQRFFGSPIVATSMAMTIVAVGLLAFASVRERTEEAGRSSSPPASEATTPAPPAYAAPEPPRTVAIPSSTRRGATPIVIYADPDSGAMLRVYERDRLDIPKVGRAAPHVGERF